MSLNTEIYFTNKAFFYSFDLLRSIPSETSALSKYSIYKIHTFIEKICIGFILIVLIKN